MKRKFILSTVLLIVVSFAVLGATYSWFISSKAIDNVTFETGSIQYVLTGNLKDPLSSEYIIPGEELVDNTIGVENYSSIESQLRIKIAYQLEGGTVTTFVSENTNGASTTASLIGVIDSKFTYNATDDYWYYFYEVGNAVIPPNDELALLLEVAIISSLYANGNVVGSTLKTKKLGVTIIFEAKQKKNVSWEDTEWAILATTLIEN